MAKKLFHWLYGGTSDLKNNLSLVANNDASVLANSSRHNNQQSAFQIGDPNTANSSAAYYAQGGNLSNVGTERYDRSFLVEARNSIFCF